jgi:hypothetical protein
MKTFPYEQQNEKKLEKCISELNFSDSTISEDMIATK